MMFDQDIKRLLYHHVGQRIRGVQKILSSVDEKQCAKIEIALLCYRAALRMLPFGKDEDLVYGWHFRTLTEIADQEILEVVSELLFTLPPVRQKLIGLHNVEAVVSQEYNLVTKNDPILH